MPIECMEITENLVTRVAKADCWLCFKPMNVKIGDVIVRKHTRKSRYAHIPCAILKNWIKKSEIDKLYLAPVTRNQ